MDNEELTTEWLRFARTDLESARFLLKMLPVPIEIVCYHCQQSAEKALKAVLVKQGVQPRKIHDLNILLQECLPFDAAYESLAPLAARLTDYAILTRYPHELAITEDDAKAAIADAQGILEEVFVHIPNSRFQK